MKRTSLQIMFTSDVIHPRNVHAERSLRNLSQIFTRRCFLSAKWGNVNMQNFIGKENITILTYRVKLHNYCDVFQWTPFRWTSTEVKYFYPTSSRCEKCMPNVIYYKFSYDITFYRFSWRNFNVILESALNFV